MKSWRDDPDKLIHSIDHFTPREFHDLHRDVEYTTTVEQYIKMSAMMEDVSNKIGTSDTPMLWIIGGDDKVVDNAEVICIFNQMKACKHRKTHMINDGGHHMVNF